MPKYVYSILILSLIFTGCAPETHPNSNGADEVLDTDEFAALSGALIEGTPETIGLLAFLNDADTTLDVLDYDVPLNKRAAKNLVHHRNGWDGLAGTSDDDPFDSIEEVDAVKWIGSKTINKMLNYAAAWGWVPEGDDVLGTWDKVEFTVNEAQVTLDLVNNADHYYLDVTLALDKRAANAIIAAQPVGSIAHLASLYYVGKSGLKNIRTAACTMDAQQDPSEQQEEDLQEGLQSLAY